MEYIKAVILGIVQGLTEFLPISSSGHLVLSKYFLGFGGQANISFEIFVHLGSLVAVLIFFRKEILVLLKSLIHYKNPDYANERKTCLWLAIATLITGVLGLLLKDFFTSFFEIPLVVAVLIAITGAIIYISDKIRGTLLESHELNVNKSILIGLGQAIAILPGISRSGTTITCALWTGLSRKNAASFSFILSIPAILGANISEFKTFSSLDSSQLMLYIIGFITAFISGYLVIKLLIKMIERAKLCYFSYYCWAISFVCIILLIAGL